GSEAIPGARPGDRSAASHEPRAGPSLAPTTGPTNPPAPTKTPGPTATPNTSATIVSFTVPTTINCNNPDNPAPFAHLSWKVKNATGVQIFIDSPTGLYDSYPGTSNSADVPFSCSATHHVYYATTTGGTTTASSHKTALRAVPK